ncbi:uncharacterized protein LOC62_01G001415 [Vanrija pseudolonga]|uniref:Uncharacterized protein n=1 Tax=Vanrija pseudolonga TaxID=143232 RepID=A0AAF0Y0Z6_9TREE|nr:hypothetical protein LOC62_01G001415 [Vanrija pseudolonga]
MKWTAALVLAAAGYITSSVTASPLPVPTYIPPIAPVYGAVEVDEVPPAPALLFTSEFPSELTAGSKLELAWEGGDGRGVEVYFIPRWARQREYEQVPIAPNTTASALVWHVPKLADYPAGTNMYVCVAEAQLTSSIIGVKDGSEGPGSTWWDLSPPLALV